MFWNRNKIKKDMIPNLTPTSKASLKMTCLISANGDIDKAQKLYDYMIQDMDDLPLFDVRPPSTMEQIKNGVNDTMKWIGDNQEQILFTADLFSNVFKRSKGTLAKSGQVVGGLVDDVANVAVNASANAIPNINKQ